MSIRRRVVNLSLPVLLSSLFQRLVSIVDIFLVGGLGAAAIAATGLGQLLIFVVMTVFWGLATGTTVVIAHLWGGRCYNDARTAAFTACLACGVMAAAATLLGCSLGDPLARFLGARDDVLVLASAPPMANTPSFFSWAAWCAMRVASRPLMVSTTSIFQPAERSGRMMPPIKGRMGKRPAVGL